MNFNKEKLYLSVDNKREAIRIMKEKNSSKSNFLNKFAFSFDGRFVIVLFLVLGCILLLAAINLEGVFPKEFLMIISGGFITSGLFEIILHFSSQSKNLNAFENSISDAKSEILKQLKEKEERDIIVKRMRNDLTKVEVKKENLDGGTITISEQDFDKAADILLDYMHYCVDSTMIYMDSFERNVFIKKGKNALSNCITVETETKITYINFSDKTYIHTVEPQFLIGDGSGNTYKVLSCKKGKDDITDIVKEQLKSCELERDKDKDLYESGLYFEIDIPAYQAMKISYTTEHQMPLTMFYQAKKFNSLCRKVHLKASWDESLMDPQNDYIFRWTMFESREKEHEDPFSKHTALGESFNGTLKLDFDWIKPGNGFALTAGVIDKKFRKEQSRRYD